MDTIRRITAVALLSLGLGATHGQSREANPAPASAPTAGAQQAGEEPDDEVRRVDAIRQYGYARRDDAVAVARRANAAIDRRMEALQADVDHSWERMSDQARSGSREQLRALRARRTELAEWYGGLRHGSAEAWDKVRTGFVTSYHAMADALQRARADLGRKEHARPEGSQPESEPPPPKQDR